MSYEVTTQEIEKQVRDWFEEVLPKFIAYTERHRDKFKNQWEIGNVMDFVAFVNDDDEFDEEEEFA